MFWRNGFKDGAVTNKIFGLVIIILGVFFVSQINYSAGNSQVKKVKIEYFGRKDCKNSFSFNSILLSFLNNTTLFL